jgi:Uma2 family endonuclease
MSMPKDTKLDLNKLNLTRFYAPEELELINNNLKVRTNFENGRLIPITQAPIAHEAVVHEISRQLGNWNVESCQNGVVTTSQGAFNFGNTNGQKKIIAPHVAFTAKNTYDSLNDKQLWTLRGQPFTPTFVVEVVNATSETILNEVDNRFKNDYFAMGTSVELGWLIDPKSKGIWTYKRNNSKIETTRQKCEWKDLDGGDTLPGFTLNISLIEKIISQVYFFYYFYVTIYSISSLTILFIYFYRIARKLMKLKLNVLTVVQLLLRFIL